MSLVCIEDGDSRSATIQKAGRKGQSTYVKSWKIFGTKDDAAVHAYVATNLPLYWQYPGGNPNQRLYRESYSVSYLGDDAWHVKANYLKDGADGQEPLKSSRSFDTGGGTQKITQALDERVYGDGPSYGGAIAVDDNGVNGVDIVVPQLHWQETYDVPAHYVSNQYIRAVADLTGSVNQSTFRTFQMGEVLFLGCSGSQEWNDEKGHGPWNLTYKFSANPNVSNQTVGGISGVMKRGYEYLWVKYRTITAQQQLSKEPVGVYVNQVYKYGNFATLGIGT